MNIDAENSGCKRIAGGDAGLPTAALKQKGVTLVEVMVVVALLTILFIAGFGGICSMRLISHRVADYTAGMALAQAEIHNIRAAAYPGTNFPINVTTVQSNNISVDLNEAGTTFLIPGTVVATITPIAWGHLVSVKATIKEVNGSPMTVSLQTVVNNYSGGRGKQ
jgi:prepilin-type N-terminal cleavage/methylation domain-containing protein